MKKIPQILYLFIVTTVISSCSKNDDNMPGKSPANPPGLKSTASVDASSPCGIAVSVNGKVAVTEYKEPYGSPGTTRVWNNYSDMLAKKAPIASWQNIAAEAIAFDKNENIYISETEQTAALVIYRKAIANGVTSYSYFKKIQAGFNNPRGLAFDSHNKLYVADDGNDRLLRFNDPMNSDAMQVVAGVFGGLKGLAIQNDTLYVTAYDSHRLYKCILNADGTFSTMAIVNMAGLVDVALYNGILALSTPDNSTVTLLNAGTLKTTASYTGVTKQLHASGAIYGLAFVKTSSGYGLLSAQNALNKIVLYE